MGTARGAASLEKENRTIDQKMNTNDKQSHRRRGWRLALLLLVVLPFIPEFVVYAAAGLGKLVGCQIDQAKPCVIGPISLGDVIVRSLNVGLFWGRMLGVAIASVVWLPLCYYTMTRGWAGIVSRLFLALVIATLFVLLPFAPLLVIKSLSDLDCSVVPCGILGGVVNYDHAVKAGELGVSLGLAVALLALIVYLGGTIIVRFARTLRARRS
jgi:hypothetical protein